MSKYRIFKVLTICIIAVVIVLSFTLYSLYSNDEKDTYDVGGVSFNSLYFVTGKKENVVSKNFGNLLNNGKYFYIIFDFSNNSKRDNAASEYSSYLKKSLLFSDLDTHYFYDIGLNSETSNILVNFEKITKDKSINVGVDCLKDKTLKLIFLVYPLNH